MKFLKLFAVLLLAGGALYMVAGSAQGQMARFPYVDGEGNISVPEDFRSWAFLGTWAVAADDDSGDVAGFHNVYTQPETIQAYRESGKFPDGAVLVKELFKTSSADMTTGRVGRASEVEGWFVMIKDTQGRFPESGIWGDGWGWALFYAKEPEKNVATDYTESCLGCHVPAKDTDWVYVQGYPVLQGK